MAPRLALLLLLVLVPSAFFMGRQSAWEPARIPLELSPSTGTPVATFGGRSISVDQLQARLEALPASERGRFSTPEGKRKLLHLVLRTELLASEAASKGFDRDPAIHHAAKQAMVDRFLAREFDEAAIGARLKEEQLRLYYQEHLSEFRRPATAEASVLFVSAPAEGKERQKKFEHAQALLESLRRDVPQSPRAFEALAQLKSEDPISRPKGGETGRVSRGDLAKRWGNGLAEAIFSLTTPNQLTEVVETEGGFAVAKLKLLVPGIDESFEKSQERIRSQLASRERLRLVEERVLRAGHVQGLVLHEDALSKVR